MTDGNLDELYERLKAILKEYEGPFQPKAEEDGKYGLWSFKALEIAGRKRKEMNFATLIVRGNYVGFYYMPIYTDTDLKEVFEPELLRTLKGKSCFHITSLDDTLESQIRKALEIGFELYKKRGWVTNS